MNKAGVLILLAALCGAWPAAAHHSSAMFDGTKVVTVTGAVKDYQFVQPHTWIDVSVTDPAGKETIWAVEGGATGQMRNVGLTPSTLKPGDKVTVSIHPLRDGRPAGSFISIVMPDGKTISARAPAAAPAGP